MKNSSRIGICLFLIYCCMYLGFMLINTFAPSWMESKPLLGLNLSVTYGFSLIFTAFILAIIYGIASAEKSSEPASDDGKNRIA